MIIWVKVTHNNYILTRSSKRVKDGTEEGRSGRLDRQEKAVGGVSLTDVTLVLWLC